MMMKFAGLATALTIGLAGAAIAESHAPVITDMSIGSADAKVTVVEYLSFTCPHCAAFHDEVFTALKPDYIDSGKVRFEYHEVYFDRYGLWGAMLARCGGEMKYFGITDMLFEKQRDWAAFEDPTQVVEALKTIGRAAGLEDAAMDTCLKDQATAEALVAHYQTSLEADFPGNSFEGTPSFIVNGEKVGNMGLEEFKALLDAKLAE